MAASISIVPSPSLTPTFPLWQPATWEDYLAYRDRAEIERVRLYFNSNRLLVEMGAEGLNHANVSDLFVMLLGFWFAQHPDQVFNSFGRCLLERPKEKAGAPDIILYLGEDYPRWQPGDRRCIDLERHPIPHLVAEISDTTEKLAVGTNGSAATWFARQVERIKSAAEEGDKST